MVPRKRGGITFAKRGLKMATTAQTPDMPGKNSQARGFRILFAHDNYQFRELQVNDPIPLGRQILSAAGASTNGEIGLFAILDNGEFEDIRLDEPFDLREKGAERFIAFQSDRSFKFHINGKQAEWGKPLIPGRVLYDLGKANGDEAIFQEVPGGTDVQIEPSDLVDLTAPGVERFIAAARRKIVILVNGREKEVTHRHQTFEQLVQLAYPGEAPSAEVKFSITYRHAASVPHSGELSAGGSITVKTGSVINVCRTIQS